MLRSVSALALAAATAAMATTGMDIRRQPVRGAITLMLRTRAHLTDITDLAGSSVVSSSAPARGTADTGVAVATATAAAATAGLVIAAA